MKRIIKTVLKKLFGPVLSKYYYISDQLNKLNKIDEKLISVLSILSVNNPITEYPPARGTLRKRQLAQTKVLFAFDRLCKENGLRYWLDGGTNIGAVRHGGFIPWDNDTDVGMLPDDFDRFIQIISALPQDGRIQYYCYSESKIKYKKNYLIIKYIEDNLVFYALDVFCYHQYYKRTNVVEEKQLIKRMEECQRKIYNNIIFDSDSQPFAKMLFHNDQPSKDIVRELIMENKNPAEDGDIFFISGPVCVLRYEWIFPLSTMSFEGRELPVPHNSEKVLERQYGDFMRYPPDMYSHHGFVFDDLRENWRRYENLDAFLSMSSDDVYDLMTGKKK
jgi:lipopolysaccharide cholinephosphotransferase